PAFRGLAPTATYFRRCAAVAMALICGLADAGNSAEPDFLTIKSATVGFGGKFKAGFWQPVRLTVIAGPAGARGRLELQVTDGDQAPVVYRDESRGAVDLSPGEETTTHLYCKSGPIAAPITVRLIAGR